MSKKYLVIQLGARHHYAIPRFLYQNKILHSFNTDGYLGGFSLHLVPKNFKKARLRNSKISFKPVYTFNLLGVIHFVLRKYLFTKRVSSKNKVFVFISSLLNIFTIINFKIRLKEKPTAIFGFNGASFLCFKYFKRSFKVVDQAMGPRSRMKEELFSDEIIRKYSTQNLNTAYSNDIRSLIESKEWDLANLILAPSNFVHNLLLNEGVHASKCKIINYGVDIHNYSSIWTYKLNHLPKTKLNILFVGEVGIRKGVPYLLEALKKLEFDYECILAGNITLNKIDKNNNNLNFKGRVDREKIKEFYKWADLLIIPSLWEGSATVIYEATACRLPVIATFNAGAPNTSNVIEIPTRSTTHIASALSEVKNNYESYRPVERDLYHVSLERYYKELLTVLS